jgi:hypothetical protein
MSTFLSDPPQTLVLVLAAAVVVACVVWFNRRTRKTLVAFLSLLAATVLLLLIDRLAESPREEAVRRVQAMVRAADAHDAEAFASHLADSVTYQGEKQPRKYSRDDLRRHHIWSLLRQFRVHVAAWDFSRHDVTYTDENTVEIGFLAKGEAEGKQFPFYFRATFQKQPDGQMKLVRLASFDALQRQNKPVSIPSFD